MRQSVIGLTLALVSGLTMAASPDESVRTALTHHFPDLSIDTIQPAPMAGYQQVTSGPLILYVSDDGHYVLNGEVIALTEKGPQNVTEDTRRSVRLKALNQLSDSDYITYPAKTPIHTITVFTDLDCGYCRKLHDDVPPLNEKGITVRYLSFPRAGINSDSYKTAVSVWCSPIRAETFADAKAGKTIASRTCDNNPVKTSFELGALLGITGTPTIILENGALVGGYLPPDELLKALSL